MVSVVKPRPKFSQRPIKKKKNTFKNQWELTAKTNKLLKAREKAGDQVVIG